MQVLLSSDTTAERATQASHTLCLSFIGHFRQIVSNPKSHHHNGLIHDPTAAIHSVFLLLAQLYLHPKLTSLQQAQVADIILDLVVNTLCLVNDLCAQAIKSAIYNDPPLPLDYREAFSRGILALVGACSLTSPLRQRVILVLVLEFRAVRCSEREGKVAVLTRDDVLWYLCAMIEECVTEWGLVEGVWTRQVRELVWESLSSDDSGGMSKSNWLAWRVCGLVCGIGGVDVEMQESD